MRGSSLGCSTTHSDDLPPLGTLESLDENASCFYFVAHVGQNEDTGSDPDIPARLFFKHAGHRDKVVDFHWNVDDPWTIVSVSDDREFAGGGGTLQIWRMTDLLSRPEDKVSECSKTS